MGALYGTQWFFKSALLLFLLTDGDFMSSHNAAPSPSVILQPTKRLLANRPFAISICGMFTIFSLWILKRSSANLYRGWHKKGHAIKDLAKIDKLLAQLENIKFEPMNIIC